MRDSDSSPGRKKGGVAEWTEEETEELFRQYIKTRSREVRDQLVMMHQNLVRFLAGKFANYRIF